MPSLALVIDLAESILLPIAAVYLFSHADATERRSPVVYYGFALVVWLFSNFYWTLHEFIRHEAVYPFSAIDIASAGFDLLLGSSLAVMIDGRNKVSVPALVGSGVFSLLQGALWILWNGDWLKDTMGALTIWYLAYYLCVVMLRCRLLSKGEWTVLIASSLITGFLQVWSYLTKDSYGSTVDQCCGVLYLAVSFLLVVKLARVWNDDTAPQKAVVCLVANVLWTLCAMYMSFEPRYRILQGLAVVLMALAARAFVRMVERT